VNPTTNGSPRSPDLAAIGDSLELVWVSDSLIPGIQMVERAPYEGGGWHSPEMVSFGNIMSSPSVAADRDGAVLYAWIINNLAVTGIPALVHTQLRTDSEIYEPRARPGLAVHYRVSVAAAASGQFIMLTAEGDGGPDISITVREGDGRVFYPRVDANTGLDIGNPKLAANYGQSDVAAYWSGFDDPNEPVIGATCLHPVTSAPTPDVVVLDRRLRGHPNPFNPGTEFHFELARDSYVILELFDLRGRLVRELYRGELERGPQAIPWDGRDGNGVGLASGTYLARLKRHDGSVSVTKVALLK
jgi:hypothetical protein